MSSASKIVCFAAAAGLAACSTLPRAGPTQGQVSDQASDENAAFNLIEIDPRVLSVVGAIPSDRPPAPFEGGQRPAVPRVGVGDAVSVLILQAPGPVSVPGAGAGSETGSGGGGGGMQGLTLPPQVVGPDGAISVPFAGRVQAAGRTPAQIGLTIERLLAGRLIEPQAIVTVPTSAAEAVTVSSETVGTVRVPLSLRGDRLLDVIAAAGGDKSPLYDSVVRLSRDGEVASIPLDELATNQAENVFARPGDVISLIRSPQTFSVFGATFNNAELPFNAPTMSLAQAIARVGGLQDTRADPAGVYLFRFEPRPALAQLGSAPRAVTSDGRVPVVYHLDLQNVGGYFLAKRFLLRNGDMVYVANAAADTVQKFFTLVGTLSGPVITGVVLSRGNGGG